MGTQACWSPPALGSSKPSLRSRKPRCGCCTAQDCKDTLCKEPRKVVVQTGLSSALFSLSLPVCVCVSLSLSLALRQLGTHSTWRPRPVERERQHPPPSSASRQYIYTCPPPARPHMRPPGSSARAVSLCAGLEPTYIHACICMYSRPEWFGSSLF